MTTNLYLPLDSSAAMIAPWFGSGWRPVGCVWRPGAVGVYSCSGFSFAMVDARRVNRTGTLVERHWPPEPPHEDGAR